MDNGRILNLAAHDPQKWPMIIKVWSQLICRKFDKLEVEKTASEMYAYLEKFLGETARAAWGSYKQKFPADFHTDINLGPNPYNFTNKIQALTLGQAPNVGIGAQQVEAIRKLEQLQIKMRVYIKSFLLDFIYYSTIADCFYIL